MKIEILRVFRNTGDYLSGQQLYGMLGVSRIVIWKTVGGLREGRYVVETVRNRGYRLVEDADVITQAEFASMMYMQWIGIRLEHSDETNPTNIRTRGPAEEGASHGTLVVVDRRAARKGRRGKSRVSPVGIDI